MLQFCPRFKRRGLTWEEFGMARDLTKALIALTAVLTATGATAQQWPTKQIKVIVPFTAGSATDIVARAVFEQIGREHGQSVVVENRGGGGTTIGSAAVAKSDPDGYTVLVNSTSHVVVATTFPKLSYNVAEDFTALSGLAAQPFVITTRTKYKSLADFIAYGKANPGKINYGSAGIGTSGMLFSERLALATGIKMTHVPFRGTPEAMTEIIADRLDMFPGPVVSVVGLVADKKVAALAVSTPKRAKAFPDVPTLQEAGVKGADYTFWAGAFVPSKTPKAVSSRIHGEIIKALANPEVVKRIDGLGAEPMPMAMADFDKFVREEIAMHADIYKKAGLATPK
jgi:tripartite-type tricarboxylate transporter receptor subunit TctC